MPNAIVRAARLGILLAVSALSLAAQSLPDLQQRLCRGWNTWDSRSVLTQVLLPDAFALNLGFKQRDWLGEETLASALIGRRGPDTEKIRPGLHAYDGSYTELEIRWRNLAARVETGHDGADLVVLVTPLGAFAKPVTLYLETGMLWNRPGTLNRDGQVLQAQLPRGGVQVFCTARLLEDPYLPPRTPYLAMDLAAPIGIATGRTRTVAEIQAVLKARRSDLERTAAPFPGLEEAFLAIQSGIAWNTIFEPKGGRVLSTVGRLWNEEYGGYCTFGWDNCFLAYMTGLASRDLALANLLEHLKGATSEGFIPNDNRGNDTKSWDRSQPPVGSLMVRGICRKYPEERWFMAAAFDPLLAWNRWWPRARMNQGLLSYGSHAAQNPLGEPDVRTKVTAGYESGMDDSPMYEGVPFDPVTSTMALQDVGLTSLYIADCQALADMAALLGRPERAELLARAAHFKKGLEALWSQPEGLYLNHRTDTGEASPRLSPTLFYPMLAGVPSPARASRMVSDHLLNPKEFWGDFVLPSIARNDPAFPRQRYWKGAIWPPLNFLTYLSLRRAGSEAASPLAAKSLALFLKEWERQGYVSENYSAITGTGDDERLSSDRFHSWGALFALPAFIEKEFYPAP